MTTPPSSTPKQTLLTKVRQLRQLFKPAEQSKERKQWGLFKTVMLGLATSLLALVLAMWLFAYQATLGKPAWVWIPPIKPNEMFEVIRNAVTAVAALGVGVTLFLSYRKQRTTEHQLQATLDANSNAVDALDQAKSEHKEALKRATTDRADAQHRYFVDQNLTRESLQQNKDSLALALKQHGSDAMDKLRSRYSTAAEQIGSSNASLAVAGVISMASVADEWHKFSLTGDRDDCIRMLVAGIPGSADPRADIELIRATCHSLFDQRMAAGADSNAAWWNAGINFTISTGMFGPIDKWVLDASRVRFRASQLAVPNSPSVQNVTIDGGVLDITLDDNVKRLQLKNLELRQGGVDIKLDGLALNQEVAVLFTSLNAYGGSIKFEDSKVSTNIWVISFRHCTFTSGIIVLPAICDRYELVFNKCTFSSTPFRYVDHIKSAPPTIRLNGSNDFLGQMEDFPIGSPEALLNYKFLNSTIIEGGAEPYN